MKETQSGGIGRRDFLKGAAFASTLAITGMGLAGCEPANQGTTTPSDSTSEARTFPGITNEDDFAASEVVLETITEFSEEEEYDIVVAGAGIAGIPAVITAVDEGATVCCLQKQNKPQGNGNYSSGIVLEASDPQATFQWMQRMRTMNNYRVNWDLLQFFADNSGETHHYLDRVLSSLNYPADSYTTSHSITFDDGDYLAYSRRGYRDHNEMLQKLADYAESKGAVFHYSTPAVQLIVDNGAATGIIGKKEDGTYIKLKATKGVIIATGDYENNDSMKEKYLPELLHIESCQAQRTGDGHLMTVLAGGQLVPQPHTKQVHDVFSTTFGISATPMLALNHHGKRFMNENTVMPMWVNETIKFYDQQDRGTFFRFFDNAFDTKFTTFPPREDMEKYIIGQEITPEETTQVPYNPSMIGCYRADTIEELATKMDLDPAAVQGSIDQWNEYCDQGVDPDFGVPEGFLRSIDTPPYWGIANHVRTIAINSGVLVDGNYQVLSTNYEPIPGLYAAGTCAGNMDGAPDWQMSSGVSNGHCMTAGRYTVIRALTGGSKPSNPATWAEVEHLYADIPTDTTWQKTS